MMTMKKDKRPLYFAMAGLWVPLISSVIWDWFYVRYHFMAQDGVFYVVFLMVSAPCFFMAMRKRLDVAGRTVLSFLLAAAWMVCVLLMTLLVHVEIFKAPL